MQIKLQQRVPVPIVLSCLLSAAGLHADEDYPLELGIGPPKPPKKNEEPKTIMYRAGWLLSFEATVTDENLLGIGRIFGPTLLDGVLDGVDGAVGADLMGSDTLRTGTREGRS